MEERNNSRKKGSPEEEQSAKQTGKKARRPKKKRRIFLKILAAIGTLILVGAMAAAIFVNIFLKYIDTTMRGHVEVDLTEYTQEVSTELYYQDPDTEEWVMYQTLFANENRIWVESEDIPEYLKKATIAIEDRRFETHKGVDWRGIVRAVVSTVTGDGVQGASTITQQLIKNITGNNENTVKRKITEIYRALALEEEGYSKDEILTIYLNTIFMGNQCYGVKTAAEMYFGKDVSELTLAECASLISITNNPSMYDPLRADWCREENRERQLKVLDDMLELEMIDQATHDAAAAEEIVFTNGWTNLGNQVEVEGSGEDEDGVVSTANNSYYTDAVISDVAEALVELYGLGDDPADADGYVRTAFEKAVAMVYGKGLKIYTCQNPDYQELCEDVFENTSMADYTDSKGKPLQAAITLMDPYTGDVLAMVGGTGAKEVDRGWNWATEVRQCGSAIKPISTYAPALDNGTITAASIIDDYPIHLEGYGAYPKNSYGTFDGLSTIQEGLKWSSNCMAVKINQLYGTTASYNFMVEKLGFTTLNGTDSQQVGNMALGGLDEGVTTEEMAAAFSAFVNDGIYTAPRTFLRVEDNNGEVIIDNASESNVAMKETTAYLIRQMLKTVVASGTGTEADFSGMATAGKTGTTDANRDRYFVGFTPYYCAAVWCGYQSNEEIDISGNPSARLWRSVMKRIHDDLDYKDFGSCSGMKEVTVCLDSGMLATEACNHDLRGNRTRTVKVAADTAPKDTCTMHTMVKYCTEGKHVATEFCPEETVKEVALLNYDRVLVTKNGDAVTAKNVVKGKDHQYLLKVAQGLVGVKAETGPDGETVIPLCPKHKEPAVVEPPVVEPPVVDPNNPQDPNNPEGGENPGGEGGTPGEGEGTGTGDIIDDIFGDLLG
ncbi:MAG: transglycosylase domain-containing protein [Oscillospiraceae bacterium]|nr:transglycosylase domain-containing protein [Oscillospiraceae bacterium]